MHTLTAQVEDLFENGIINILRTIPGRLPEDERLAIESVVYPAYGFYRTYRRLEASLIGNTNDDGTPTADPGCLREMFADLWSLIDTAYAVRQVAALPLQRAHLKLSPETADHLREAAALRNYMDHLRDNFRNSIKARGWFPLFGLATYQFTPHIARPEVDPNHVLLVSIASTHIRGKTTVPSSRHISTDVYGLIDHITLHLKDGKTCDLSRLMCNLALDLNAYSMSVQLYLSRLFQHSEHQAGGIMLPYPTVVVRTDFGDEHAVSLNGQIKTYLDANKARATVQIDSEG